MGLASQVEGSPAAVSNVFRQFANELLNGEETSSFDRVGIPEELLQGQNIKADDSWTQASSPLAQQAEATSIESLGSRGSLHAGESQLPYTPQLQQLPARAFSTGGLANEAAAKADLSQATLLAATSLGTDTLASTDFNSVQTYENQDLPRFQSAPNLAYGEPASTPVTNVSQLPAKAISTGGLASRVFAQGNPWSHALTQADLLSPAASRWQEADATAPQSDFDFKKAEVDAGAGLNASSMVWPEADVVTVTSAHTELLESERDESPPGADASKADVFVFSWPQTSLTPVNPDNSDMSSPARTSADRETLSKSDSRQNLGGVAIPQADSGVELNVSSKAWPQDDYFTAPSSQELPKTNDNHSLLSESAGCQQTDLSSSSWPQTSLGQVEADNFSQAWPGANVQSMEEALPKTESSRSLGSADIHQVDSISSAAWPQSRQAPEEPDASGVAWPQADMAVNPSAQEALPRTESNLSLRGASGRQHFFCIVAAIEAGPRRA
eukprot:TRINITY_DN9921_c0_g1_i7.p1 TRINITY_DN9921_c0_g1~~TRINITY_DN9921_c0_g1_i7.p1  ORF type:complete len:499 (-),score=87.90 TRINITY_DN9921_c0_g1_i7:151-1647(-)